MDGFGFQPTSQVGEELPDWLRESFSRDLSFKARLVLIALRVLLPSGEAKEISHDFLAEHCGMSESTISTAMAELEEAKRIQREWRRTHGPSRVALRSCCCRSAEMISPL